jgi:hypothetical protein
LDLSVLKDHEFNHFIVLLKRYLQQSSSVVIDFNGYKNINKLYEGLLTVLNEKRAENTFSELSMNDKVAFLEKKNIKYLLTDKNNLIAYPQNRQETALISNQKWCISRSQKYWNSYNKKDFFIFYYKNEFYGFSKNNNGYIIFNKDNNQISINKIIEKDDIFNTLDIQKQNTNSEFVNGSVDNVIIKCFIHYFSLIVSFDMSFSFYAYLPNIIAINENFYKLMGLSISLCVIAIAFLYVYKAICSFYNIIMGANDNEGAALCEVFNCIVLYVFY